MWRKNQAGARNTELDMGGCPRQELPRRVLVAAPADHEWQPIQAAMHQAGIEVVHPDDAMSIARGPGVIVVGMSCPEPFATLAMLRGSPGWDPSPAIVMVERCSHALVTLGIARGVDQFWEAPFDFDRLVTRVDGLIEQGNKDPFDSGSFTIR